MAAVEPAHRVCHEVDPASWGFDLQEPVELLRARSDRAGTGHRGDDDFGADDLAEDAKDGRPVLHTQARWAADVEAV